MEPLHCCESGYVVVFGLQYFITMFLRVYVPFFVAVVVITAAAVFLSRNAVYAFFF